MAKTVSFVSLLATVAVGAAWFYATLALCVATYTATAALGSLLVATASWYVILHAPRPGELPQYAPLEEAAARVLALAPPRRLIELWSMGPTVGFVVALVAVSADGRFHMSFALLVLAAAIVLPVSALGGEGVVVAGFCTTTWWMAFNFYQIDQYGVALIAVAIGPPLGLIVCGIGRGIAAATRAAQRVVGRSALVLPPLLLFLALAPVYKWLHPAEKSAAPKVPEKAPDAKSFVTGAHFLKLEAAAKVPRAPNGVPRVVHQTWRSHKMRPDHRAMFDSWSRCLPQGWLHVLWTDAEVRSLGTAASAPAASAPQLRHQQPTPARSLTPTLTLAPTLALTSALPLILTPARTRTRTRTPAPAPAPAQPPTTSPRPSSSPASPLGRSRPSSSSAHPPPS